MPAAPATSVWEYVAWLGGAAAVTGAGVALIVYINREGPPKQETLTPTGEGPPESEPAPPLPPKGDKASSYPGAAGSRTGASEWTQVQAQPGLLQVRSPSRAWGTPSMIGTIAEAAGRWSAYRTPLALDDAQIRIADVSKKGGGKLSPHVSHHQGRDVDVTISGLGERLPPVALPTLLRAFLEDSTDNVRSIYLSWQRQREVWDALDLNPELDPDGLVRRELQYPMAPHTGRTKVRHWDGHRNHIHVRTRR